MGAVAVATAIAFTYSRLSDTQPQRGAPVANGRASTVTVHEGRVLAMIQRGAVGLEIWSPHNNSAGAEAAELYRAGGVQAPGVDGGPAVDLFDWRKNTLRTRPNPERASANYATTHGPYGTFAQVEHLRPSVLPQVAEEMLRRRYTQADVIGVLGENYLRLLTAQAC